MRSPGLYIWAGLKSHNVGQHDYPQFLADWSKLLTERGAVVNGALHAPSVADLEQADVVVIYKGDAGFMSDTDKSALDGHMVTPDIKAIVPKLEPVLAKPFTQLFLEVRTGG